MLSFFMEGNDYLNYVLSAPCVLSCEYTVCGGAFSPASLQKQTSCSLMSLFLTVLKFFKILLYAALQEAIS